MYVPPFLFILLDFIMSERVTSDIHRLGRTARAGRGGAGLLILTSEESFFLKKPEIRPLPLVAHPEGQSLLGPQLDKWRQATHDALARVLDDSKAKAYAVSIPIAARGVPMLIVTHTGMVRIL